MRVSSHSGFCRKRDVLFLDLLILLLAWMRHIDGSMCNSPHGDRGAEPGWKTKYTWLAAHRNLPDLNVTVSRCTTASRREIQRKKKLPYTT